MKSCEKNYINLFNSLWMTSKTNYICNWLLYFYQTFYSGEPETREVSVHLKSLSCCQSSIPSCTFSHAVEVWVGKGFHTSHWKLLLCSCTGAHCPVFLEGYLWSYLSFRVHAPVELQTPPEICTGIFSGLDRWLSN